jgi:hypothetical protein
MFQSSPVGLPLYGKHDRSRDRILQELPLRLHPHSHHVHRDVSCGLLQPDRDFSSCLPDEQGSDCPSLYGIKYRVQEPHTES